MLSQEQCIELDLSKDSEAVRRELYDRIRRSEFLPEAANDDEEPAGEPYSAEEAQLKILYVAGRYLAQWRRLEVPDSAPEAQRMELLRVRPAGDNPRGFMLHEC